MRRARLGLVLGAALVVLVLGVLLALPLAVRHVTLSRVEAATGRAATVEAFHVNLFTRRVVIEGFRLSAEPDLPDPVAFARLDARFRLLPVFRGQLHLETAELVAPNVRIIRSTPAVFNISDIVANLRAGPPGLPLAFDHLSLVDGAIHFEDRAAAPARAFAADGITAEVYDVRTFGESADGVATVALTIAGAPVTITADELRGRPARARAAIDARAVDLAEVFAYVGAEAAVRPTGGRLTARLDLEYDAATGARLAGEALLGDVVVQRRDQAEPLVALTALDITLRDIRYRDGVVQAGHLALRGDPTVVDATGAPPQRFSLRDVELVLEDLAYPGPPGEVTLAASGPDGMTIAARGMTGVAPLTAELEVVLGNVEVAPARAHLPPDAPVTIGSGRLASTLAVTYGDDALRITGDFELAELLLLRAGQDEPFARHPRLRGHVTELVVDAAGLAIERLELAGAPTIVDALASPPQRFALAALAAVVEDATWPAQRAARVDLRAELAQGGAAHVTGTLHPATLAADVRAALTDVDLTRLVAYLPPDSPVVPAGGRLTGTASLRHAPGGPARISGDGVIADVALALVGQPDPLLTDPRLEFTVAGMVVDGTALAVDRLELAGTPTIVDPSASPPQRFALAALTAVVEDGTWPGQQPARVDVRARLDAGGQAHAAGTLHPATLAADVRATLTDVDLTRLVAYLPPDTPVAPAGGRLTGTATVHRDARGETRIEGDGTIAELALTLADRTAPFVTDPHVTFAVTGLVLRDDTVAAATVTLEGTPTLRDGDGDRERRVALRGLRLSVEDLAWPAADPAAIAFTAELPEAGRAEATGTLTLDPLRVEVDVALRGAALAPYAPFLPAAAPLAGRVDGGLRVVVVSADEFEVHATGDAVVHDLAFGPADRPPITVPHAVLEGFAARWPAEVRIARLALDAPAVLIERAGDGTFPVRAMLAPADEEFPAALPAPWEVAPAPPPVRVTVDEVVVEEGEVRFVDRTTTPFYSEEIRRASLTLSGLTTVPGERATLRLQGVVGVDAAFDLTGVIEPFGDVFFLEVTGQLQGFAVPRTNPYLRRFLEWTARTGSLTIEVHYRIVGDRLDASNEIVVERLEVEQVAPDPDGVVDRQIGLPLGLVVSLLKDRRGDIRLEVPITGTLTAPDFDFGGALLRVLRSTVSRLVTAPFRALGRVVREGERLEAVAVDPATFRTGSAVVTPEARRQLQRVADFLRASPFVGLALQPVVSGADLAGLRTEEVAVRILRLQREEGLASFAAAAPRMFARERPGQPVPARMEDVLAALRDDVAPSPEAVRALAARRLEIARRVLVEEAGIEAERLVPGEAPPPGAPGEGRIEFGIIPHG
jgi:hypothetical protein